MSIKIFKSLKILLLSLVVLVGIGYMFTNLAYAQNALPLPPPTFIITADPVSALEGGTTTIKWSAQGALSCLPLAEHPNWNWSATSGTETVGPLHTPEYKFSITCVNSSGVGGTGQIIVPVAIQKPTISSMSPATPAIGATVTVTGSNFIVLDPSILVTSVILDDGVYGKTVTLNPTLTSATSFSVSLPATYQADNFPGVNVSLASGTHTLTLKNLSNQDACRGIGSGTCTILSSNPFSFTVGGTSGGSSAGTGTGSGTGTSGNGYFVCVDGSHMDTQGTCVSDTSTTSGMPTITITAPAANSSWDFGNTKTIAWQTTKLLSSVKGQIFLARKDTSSLVSGIQTRYLIVNNLSNIGSYAWSSVGNAYALNKNGFTSSNETCNQTMPPAECYTIPTKVSAGIYVMSVWFSVNPSDVFAANSLGQFIVNGSPSNIVGMMNISSPGVALKIGTISDVISTTTSTTTTSTTSCATGDLFNRITGKPCVTSVVSSTTTSVDQVPSSPTNNSQDTQKSSATPYYNFGTVTLRRGSTGLAVVELQKFLNDKEGLGLVLDGKLGPKTIEVIRKWQSAHGLVVDGLVGPKTKIQMNAEAGWSGNQNNSNTSNANSYTLPSSVNDNNSNTGTVVDFQTPLAPVVTISASPTTVAVGGTSIITYTTSNVTSGCVKSGDWSGATEGSGTYTTPVLAQGSHIYTLVCTGGLGRTGGGSVIVNAGTVPPAKVYSCGDLVPYSEIYTAIPQVSAQAKQKDISNPLPKTSSGVQPTRHVDAGPVTNGLLPIICSVTGFGRTPVYAQYADRVSTPDTSSAFANVAGETASARFSRLSTRFCNDAQGNFPNEYSFATCQRVYEELAQQSAGGANRELYRQLAISNPLPIPSKTSIETNQWKLSVSQQEWDALLKKQVDIYNQYGCTKDGAQMKAEYDQDLIQYPIGGKAKADPIYSSGAGGQNLLSEFSRLNACTLAYLGAKEIKRLNPFLNTNLGVMENNASTYLAHEQTLLYTPFVGYSTGYAESFYKATGYDWDNTTKVMEGLYKSLIVPTKGSIVNYCDKNIPYISGLTAFEKSIGEYITAGSMKEYHGSQTGCDMLTYDCRTYEAVQCQVNYPSKYCGANFQPTWDLYCK